MSLAEGACQRNTDEYGRPALTMGSYPRNESKITAKGQKRWRHTSTNPLRTCRYGVVKCVVPGGCNDKHRVLAG